MPTTPIHVLIVDDYAPFRQFLLLLLRAREDVQVVSEASDGREAVASAKERQPQLVLLDIGLPKLNGIEAARSIRKVSQDSKILFVSQENFAEVIRKALDTGANGFVVKTDAGGELLAAIDTVIGGGHFVSSTVAGHGFNAVTVEAGERKL